MSKLSWGLSFAIAGGFGLATMFMGPLAQGVAMVSSFTVTAYLLARAGL